MNKSTLSTILGGLVAVLGAWDTIEWATFTWSADNIFKLLLWGAVALGGYMTTIETKSLNRKAK